MTCRHTEWTRLRRSDREVILEASDRPLRMLSGIENQGESASLLLLLGNRNKGQLLRLFGVGSVPVRHRMTHGETHLYVSSLKEHKNRTLMIADGDLPVHKRLPTACKSVRCHETIDYPISELESSSEIASIADETYHRLLFPFVDVVCLFVVDIGIACAVQHLVTWFERGRASTSSVLPHLVLVISNGQEKELWDTILRKIRVKSSMATLKSFQQVHFMTLPRRRNESVSQRIFAESSRSLHEKLMSCLEASQDTRRKAGYLFSTRHIARLLCASAAGALNSCSEPINLIKMSRGNNVVTSDLPMHLANLLKQTCKLSDTKDFAIPFISSCLLLDQYPPGAHSFDPGDAFNALFRDVCMEAIELSSKDNLSISPSHFVTLLEREMVRQFKDYRRLGSSVLLRRRVIACMDVEWKTISSDDTCLVCLCRRPQYALLGCIHCICQDCVKLFYDQTGKGSSEYLIDACVFCGSGTGGQIIRLKPPTAKVRVLSIDGGGARALVPLENLRMLQDAIGLPYPVQENFDLAIGTSSGAMAVCALFINGWSVDDCIHYLHMAVVLAFQRHFLLRLILFFVGGLPFLPNMLEFLVSLVVDSKYSADRIEMILRDVYGSRQSIMDSFEASKTGAMVAITLTTTHDTSTFIATNYNGVGERDPNCGYRTLKPARGLRSVPLWEILRCCTAAPYYFTPHRIDDVGSFQDGGLAFNDPTSIGVKEVSVLFPTKKPSIVASFGTGFGHQSQNPEARFPLRLFQACKKSLGHQRVDGKGGVFRLDLEFDGAQPPLDDTSKMDEIAHLARETALGSSAIERLARRLRAELFLFELDPDQPPQYINGAYACVGSISCRLRAGTTELTTFMDTLHRSAAYFRYCGRVLPERFQLLNESDQGGYFVQDVAFRVSNRKAPFEIVLHETSDDGCNISGSPFTLERLVGEQKLEPWFGTSRIQKRPRLDVLDIPCAKRRQF